MLPELATGDVTEVVTTGDVTEVVTTGDVTEVVTIMVAGDSVVEVRVTK